MGSYNTVPMARFFKQSIDEIGLAPDEFIFRGKQKIENIQIRLIDFSAEKIEEKSLAAISEAATYQKHESVTWINIDGLHNTTVLENIVSEFNFTRVVLANVLNTHARSTLKEFDSCLFVSVKMLQQSTGIDRITVENVSFIVTENLLISFQERTGDVFEPVRERLRNEKKKIRTRGTDYLLFALLDIIIDNYLYSLSLFGEKIEALEDQLIVSPETNVLDKINAYKRELNFLRKNIKPTKDMILTLVKLDSELIDDQTQIYLKELQDNIHQASEVSDSYRDMLSDQLNIYHTTISSKLNDIMKFLTVFSVVFIPLTFIAGIYGTNFDNIPELHYQYSYYIMWVVLLIVAAGMLVYFKRKKWF